MTVTTKVLYKESDNIVEILGLKNVVTDAYINTATVELTFMDRDDAELTGQTWPVTLSYVASSDGDYRGSVADTMVVNVGDEIFAKIVADAGAGLKLTARVPVRVEWYGDS